MIVRQRFSDMYLENALPAIDEVIFARFKRFPDQYSKIFRLMTSGRSIEQTTEVTGIGGFVVTPEGADTTYDNPAQGFDKTYNHVQYSLGFKATKIAMDDDKWGIIRRMSTELGKSAKDTIEVVAADVLNQAFNPAFPGPDGVELCSLLHPLAHSGGTEQNELSTSADLDPSTLELALTDFRALVDHTGKRIRIPARKLVVAPANEWNASEIVGGPMRSDTANHTINPLRQRSNMPSFSTFFVYDYLTDPDAWFLLADKEDTELRFYWREKFGVSHDIDFDSRTALNAGWMRFSVGFSNFWGVYGSPGA